VREARRLRQVFLVDLERRRDRWVEHVQLVAQHLDLAALEVVVGGARRTCAHHALDLHAEFVAHLFSGLEHLGAVRIADHLHRAFAVAQIDEDHATMVAAAVHPARQGDGLAQEGFGHKTAIVGTHGHGKTSGAAVAH
jgi:ribosomal protein S18 acetylase RimI-like enzyme